MKIYQMQLILNDPPMAKNIHVLCMYSLYSCKYNHSNDKRMAIAAPNLDTIEAITDLSDLLTLGPNDLLVEAMLNDQVLGTLILLQQQEQ